MLVGGAGQIKLTKDGSVLLHEMQIKHPTAALIARTATAQDDITGDGTTSTVLFTGELMRVAHKYIEEGVHPRIITDGYNIAKEEAIKFLESFLIKKENAAIDRDLLYCVANMSLRTKLSIEVIFNVLNLAGRPIDKYCNRCDFNSL